MQKPCRQDHTQPSASCTAWGQLARARPDLLPSMGKIAIRTMAAVASQEMAAHLGPVMGVGVACSSLVSVNHSLPPLALLFSQQHPLLPQVTGALCLVATILCATLVAEVGATAALHVIAPMGKLDHVLAALALPPTLLLCQLQQGAIISLRSLHQH